MFRKHDSINIFSLFLTYIYLAEFGSCFNFFKGL